MIALHSGSGLTAYPGAYSTMHCFVTFVLYGVVRAQDTSCIPYSSTRLGRYVHGSQPARLPRSITPPGRIERKGQGLPKILRHGVLIVDLDTAFGFAFQPHPPRALAMMSASVFTCSSHEITCCYGWKGMEEYLVWRVLGSAG